MTAIYVDFAKNETPILNFNTYNFLNICLNPDRQGITTFTFLD